MAIIKPQNQIKKTGFVFKLIAAVEKYRIFYGLQPSTAIHHPFDDHYYFSSVLIKIRSCVNFLVDAFPLRLKRVIFLFVRHKFNVENRFDSA